MNWQALDLIKSFEGCRLQSYQDSGGVWTIGWGATGPDIKQGTVWTQDQADKDVVTRVQKLEDKLTILLTRNSLSQDQVSSLTSLSYNVGIEAVSTSTLLKLVNSGDDLGATHVFLSWDHVNKKEDKGLLIRRLNEALIYIKGSHALSI